ncbi:MULTISPECIES: CvpA family protein [unclassified Streptococcus]|uniref:CvpA family protein n=1 Tax=unclassified Streptococcus TaxID=2608887 RepID=UPI00107254DB|nr:MULTISPECIES: CvpA family protein [unclassified Streptococcus]MBF0787389.1 CvpA family protein [Streptococcus sp. 19428wC2_LYSM12]MCQ9211786.1 CvpA family protein [Streptococcus sp. B01]MCQ9213025.1 CvpA family protein [Streptococcus sp. O1]TFV05611.1 CvpA family protein [Streptococcus sp. LYSM12]
MITLVLLIILVWSFYIGYSRGIVLQSYYVFASIFALIIAAAQFKKIVPLLYLWVPFSTASQGASTYYFDSQYLFSLDKIFYAGLAFLVVYALVYAVMRLVGLLMHLVRFADPDTTVTNVIGGGLAVIVALISLQIILTLVGSIPLALVQETLHKSWLANAIIQYIPVTSSLFKNLWIATIGQ